MKLKKIINSLSMMNFHQKRCETEDFYEIVFFNKDQDEWNRIISAFLGAPIKAKGVEPSKKDLELTRESGSIRVEQTLFEREFDDEIIIAKFWPWQDDIHTTLRMSYLEK